MSKLIAISFNATHRVVGIIQLIQVRYVPTLQGIYYVQQWYIEEEKVQMKRIREYVCRQIDR